MPSRGPTIGGIAVAAAVVAGAILALQSFDAEKIACEDIAGARASLQATKDAGVNASVEVYAGERADADAELSRCLSAKPIDPCEDAQKTRDAAVKGFNDIKSPPDDAPYAEFQTYFKQRDDAYNTYKKAKDALDQCRAANPPKDPVPYEKSDTKACFDAYDASIEAMRNTFEENTRAMRTALASALAALDAREKACNPPKGKDEFTDPPWLQEDGTPMATVPESLQNCRLLSLEWDSEIMRLRSRAAAIPGEVKAIDDGIKNIRERMGPVERDLRDVDTYIPPEAAKTQFEGALNALRAERKVALELSLEFYRNLLSRRQAEKAALQEELANVNAQIAARLAQIEKENQARMRAFPTNLHQSKPDKCEYYHCHGMLCGRPDPKQDGCGHGPTSQSDTECKQFIESYLQAAGV